MFKKTICVQHDFVSPVSRLIWSRARSAENLWDIELFWEQSNQLDKNVTLTEYAYHLAGLDMIVRSACDTSKAQKLIESIRSNDDKNIVVDRLYYAYWRRGLDISDAQILQKITRGIISDSSDYFLREKEIVLRSHAFEVNFCGDYKKEVKNAVGDSKQIVPAYLFIEFPLERSSPSLPYVFINMVATIDGKIIGLRGNDLSAEIGSDVDHATMRAIERASDGVLVGAETLRTTRGLWYPRRLFRFVVTSSGNIDFRSRFFTDAPHRAVVIATNRVHFDSVPEGVRIIKEGTDTISWLNVLQKIHTELGVERLLVEGGATVNGDLLRNEVVDELFLTVAPKIRLGRNVPSYGVGELMPGKTMQEYELVSSRPIGSEVFLRYRRRR